MRVRFRSAFVLLTILLAAVTVAAQSPRGTPRPPAPRGITLPADPEVQTKIEALLAMPDTLLATDFYRMDTRFGPNVTVDAVVVTAVELRTRIRGIRIGLHDEGKPVARSAWSFLDLDEAGSLSRALTGMIDLTTKWTGREEQRSTDLAFNSIGGFAVAVRQFAHAQRVFLSSGFLDPMSASIEITDFAALKQAVDQALATLADKEPESR